MPDTTGPTETQQETAVLVERRGHVLLIGLNRPAKRNAFNLEQIDQLAAAYYELENDDDIRCGVLYGVGDHFMGGLDLAAEGAIQTREHVVDGLERAPEALNMLFTGANTGKLMVRVR